MIAIKRALLSVYDKSGIVDFARALSAHGIEVISSGGTARALSEAGLAVTPVEEITGLPDLFDGRVKTLTPQVHGGLLMRRDNPRDQAQASEHGITPIDLLCVNLYPFATTVAERGEDRDACIEMIDIGGPAMIRAAAKNHAHVAVITEPAQYGEVLAELEENQGAIRPETARRLAAAAYAATGAYDAAIFRYLYDGGAPARHWSVGGELLQELRYGENPNQSAAAYVGAAGFWRAMEQLQGKELSYNNFSDLWGAWQCLAEFEETACVIIKHSTPCGAARGADVVEAFTRARDGDALSAFGGIVLLNRPANEEVARLLSEMFLEVVGAPDWSGEARAVLKKKKNLRVLTLPDRALAPPAPWACKSLGEALLVQSPMPAHQGVKKWKTVTERTPTAAELRDLDFGWRVVRHVRSNAIVLARDEMTVGIGCGQTSRIDACDGAIMKALRAELPTRGAALASDAFFPFRDVVDRAAQAGVTAIVHPGGSRRDQESIEACNEHGIAMLLTGERVFVH